MPTDSSKNNNLAATKVSQDKDPCYAENAKSMNCLSKNDYNYTKCGREFDNYKECKTFWMYVRLGRKRNGINPNLPPPDQREDFKKEYAKTGKIPLKLDPKS